MNRAAEAMTIFAVICAISYLGFHVGRIWMGMFMLPYPTTLSLPDDAEPYPKEGPCSVKMLKEKYTDDGQMEDGGKKTMVWGMDWFFCYPIKPEKVPKCTIL